MNPVPGRADHRLMRNFAGLGIGIGIAAAHAATLPSSQAQGSVSYISGGIGEDEALAMQRAAAAYPLQLEFVEKAKDGHEAYLAGNPVTIRDRSGTTLVDAVAGGPFLLAKLPPGHYTVVATNQGHSESRVVDLKPREHQRIVFAW